MIHTYVVRNHFSLKAIPLAYRVRARVAVLDIFAAHVDHVRYRRSARVHRSRRGAWYCGSSGDSTDSIVCEPPVMSQERRHGGDEIAEGSPRAQCVSEFLSSGAVSIAGQGRIRDSDRCRRWIEKNDRGLARSKSRILRVLHDQKIGRARASFEEAISVSIS